MTDRSTNIHDAKKLIKEALVLLRQEGLTITRIDIDWRLVATYTDGAEYVCDMVMKGEV